MWFKKNCKENIGNSKNAEKANLICSNLTALIFSSFDGKKAKLTALVNLENIR